MENKDGRKGELEIKESLTGSGFSHGEGKHTAGGETVDDVIDADD